MMRFPSIAITRDGMVLRESAPVKVMQFDDGVGRRSCKKNDELGPDAGVRMGSPPGLSMRPPASGPPIGGIRTLR